MKWYIEFLQATNPFILIILHILVIINARYLLNLGSWGINMAKESKTFWDKMLKVYAVILSFVFSAVIIFQLYHYIIRPMLLP
ncbi:hypothetical protein DealDRAFT_2138 [Dethiobacter alkaliphilus AHT 1]|uniref:Uncharacterized protein n=1 Tax=Dethiobacter alkaliphilus AHT 1 TaxID=555088 RepID=C0GI29_DETAL|nr:hypothetical protein DealDRAFT_2138 [Dethiobacter alkaliphilus AHT 1]